MSSIRAATVSRENDSAFRTVKNFLNVTSSCEHAAESVSRKAAAGPGIGGNASARELDSCATLWLAATKLRMTTKIKRLRDILVLCHPHNMRQPTRELGTRHHLLETSGSSL